eukprot:SAG25_NODE_68_length_17436_cov_79.923055_20_plen_160_part_00
MDDRFVPPLGHEVGGAWGPSAANAFEEVLAVKAATTNRELGCTGAGLLCGASRAAARPACSYRSLVYPGMAPLEHNFRYHSFPSLRESGSPQSSGPEQCGRSRFPKAMRESPLLGHPPQKSQYGAATPQALLGGIFGRYTPKRNGYICSPPPGHCTGAV